MLETAMKTAWRSEQELCMRIKWRTQNITDGQTHTEWLHELLVGAKKRDKLASDRETHITIPCALIYSCCLQSFDRRRISTCSGYSTGQASLGSPRRISGASYSSEERGLGEVRELRPEPGQRSQHWRYSFRRYSEYYLNQVTNKLDALNSLAKSWLVDDL